MPDIVGSSCVLCGQTIISLFDGVFCPECGGPYHHSCFGNSPKDPSPIRCDYCKGSKNHPQAIAAREERRAGVIHVSTKTCPSCQASIPLNNSQGKCGYDFDQTIRVAAVCPKCGDTKYKTARPDRWVTFVQDRICKSCQTRYMPPTPKWAGIVFVLIGVLLGGVGLLNVILRAIAGNLAGLPAMAVEICLTILGLLAIIHGIRALVQHGRA